MMPTTNSDVWVERTKRILRGEMKRRGVGYNELAALLNEIGIPENPRNIANKVARGGFSAVFLVQCLVAMGARDVRVDD